MADQTSDRLRPQRVSLPYDDISRTIVVRHIQTPAERLRGFAPEEEVESVRRVLEDGNFDYGPVMRDLTVIGRIARKACGSAPSSSRVGSLAEPLAATMLISADTEISRAIRALAEDPWLLVVGGRSIAGVITPSDLNRQAARTYFYLLLADFEIRLADVIRTEFLDPDVVLSLVGEETRVEITRRHTVAQAGEVDSDLVAAMDLSDLVNIGARSAPVRSAFGTGSRTGWEDIAGPLCEFRNQVMHLARPMLDDHLGLPRLIRMEERLRALLG